MKRIMLLALTLTGILTMTGCTSYENTNPNKEEDKFEIPEGLHSLPNFLERLKGAYEVDIEVNGVVDTIAVDGNYIRSTVDGEKLTQYYEDSRYYSFVENDGEFYRKVIQEEMFTIPFDISIVSYEDFMYDNELDVYVLTDEILIEVGIDSLYVSYDNDIDNIVFNAVIDGDETKLIYNSINTFEIQEYSIDLYNIDLIYDLFDNNYSYQVNQVEAKIQEYGGVSIESFHTREYSDVGYFNRAIPYAKQYFVKYNNDSTADVVTQEGIVTEGESIESYSSFHINMYLYETIDNPYDMLLDSYYEDGRYIYKTNRTTGVLNRSIKFSEDYKSFTMYYIGFSEESYNVTYSNFGNISYNDFMQLPEVSTSYVNLKK